MKWFSLLLFSLNASATVYFNDGVFPELATSARALALGNAYLSKVDDATAVWYNPAGLGTVRYPTFHLSNLSFEINKGWLDLAGRDLDHAGMKSWEANEVRKMLLKERGTIAHGRFQAMPNFTSRFFSIGYLYSSRLKASLEKEEDAPFEFSKRKDRGPYVGTNISLFGGIFKLGASVIHLHRKESFIESDADEPVSLGGDNNTFDGKMFLTTVGTRLTLPWIWLPTFSAKLNNAANKNFKPRKGKPRPLSIKHSLDIGFSLTPQIGNTSRLHLELTYRDLGKKFPSRSGEPGALSNARRMGFGMEFDFARSFFLRLGYGDGFGSGGIGLKTPEFEFHLTTYAVDTTSSRFRGREDRSFVLSFSSGI